MRTRILITTPKGQAIKTEKKLRPFILGITRRVKHETFTNKEDNKIMWIVEGGIRQIMKINRNVAMFETTLRMLLTNKMVAGSIKKLKKEDQKELMIMLKEKTTVDVIKANDEFDMTEFVKQ